MTVTDPPKGMSKEEWAIRCINDEEFFLKAIKARPQYLRSYLIENIEVWPTNKEMRKFDRRKPSTDEDEQASRRNRFYCDTYTKVYAYGFLELGLTPMKRLNYKFKDGAVEITERDV